MTVVLVRILASRVFLFCPSLPTMASQALPKRTTRGLRMTKLLEDEDSADEEFWNQDAFAEDEEDEKYVSESEEADLFDDDFNDDESSSDDEEVAVTKERRKPALKAPERKVPPVQAAATVGNATMKPKLDPAIADAKHFTGSDEFGDDAGLRTSKRSGVQAILKRSELARTLAKSRPGPKRPVNTEPVRQLTQAEILADAAVTEIQNLNDLQRLLNAEEATLKKAERVKKVNVAPAIRKRSWKCETSGESIVTLELRHGAVLPLPLGAPRPKTPEVLKCFITGKVAKYKDPKTKLPYFDKAAFAELRRRDELGEFFENADDEDQEMTEQEAFPGRTVEAPRQVPKKIKKTISVNAL